MISWYRFLLAIACGGMMIALSATPEVVAQTPEEEAQVATPDGLRLQGIWYPGKLGQQSDTVMIVHAYEKDISKGPWLDLAKTLREKDFAVLLFDLRGHGKSAMPKAIGDKELFADQGKHLFNKYSGVSVKNPKTISKLEYKRFTVGYYPYLLNDLASARRFIDERHDAGECNSRRLYVIADRDSCSLSMAWMCLDIPRDAEGPATAGLPLPPNAKKGGDDLMGAIWLSYRDPRSNIVNVMINKLFTDATIKNTMTNKVSMMFVHSDEDKTSAAEARGWFDRFGIKRDAKDDKDKRKYIYEVKGGKLAGVDLLDEKLKVTDQILEFMRLTKKAGYNGGAHITRNVRNIPFEALPLNNLGLVPTPK